MEEFIQVQRYEELPAAKDFESLIEHRNIPAVNIYSLLFHFSFFSLFTSTLCLFGSFCCSSVYVLVL